MTNLSDIDKQIAALQAQKQKLIEDQKTTALAKVKAALAELNALGFNYSFTDSGATAPRTRTRRPGVRDHVLTTIKSATDGLTRAQLLEAMNAKGDKKQEQAISNALVALKKANQIGSDSGTYRAA